MAKVSKDSDTELSNPPTWAVLLIEVGQGIAVGIGIATGIVGWGLILIRLGIIIWGPWQ